MNPYNPYKPTPRGSGRTTLQMQALAKGGHFVWVGQDFYYPRKLALKLGRGDINIVAPLWVLDERWRGRTLTDFVVDHAVGAWCFSNAQQHSLFLDLLPHVRSRVQ